MAQLQWTRTRAIALIPSVSWLRRLTRRLLAWEDWLTLALGLGAVLSVSVSLEQGGWSDNVPALSVVGIVALIVALLLARWPLGAWLAWPLAAVGGAAVTFWQTAVMVGPGSLSERVDAIYFRFQAWFRLASSGGISNDTLPFNVMVVGLTWLGVFLFGWSLYRWHQAWLGIIAGGVALFLDVALIGDSPTAGIVLYVLFGFMLLMRANLTAWMGRWQAQDVRYPRLISLSFLHHTFWGVLLLVAFAWVLPTGPFPRPPTPGLVGATIERIEEIGVQIQRLAGPLNAKKIVPVHNYTSALPFQSSANLSDRHLLTVTVEGAPLEGPLLLRGAVYDEYASGGWKAGARQSIDPFPGSEEQIKQMLEEGALQGQLVTLGIVVEAKSVVGTVIFSPGQPVEVDVASRIDVPAASLRSIPVDIPGGGARLSDEEVLMTWAPDDLINAVVERDRTGRVVSIRGLDGSESLLPEVAVVRPREQLAKGQAYHVQGLVQAPSPEVLRQAGNAYPSWVLEQYLRLPDTLPSRVRQLARQVVGAAATPYDRAKAIENYLRGYRVTYALRNTPPGRDTVDYFLFDSREGYFDYHASAMVVMLRALGVPARLAVGFVLDERDLDPRSGSYTVRDANAYAWVEVFFPGQGWVPFNPSPERPAELLAGGMGGDLGGGPAAEDNFFDIPLDPFAEYVIEPSDFDLQSAPPAPTENTGSGLKYALWASLGVAITLAALGGGAAWAWRRSVAGLPYPQQVWQKTARLASWAGQPPRPGQTPSEFAVQLERTFRDVPDILLLASVYNRSRFGHREPTAQERERLRRIWPHLRGALLGAIVRHLWHRRA